jgi:two-component system, response regulator PdtaR
MREVGRPSAAILIVEDEPLIRMDAVYLIEDASFEVYEAATADAAVALLELHKEIRLIFTDVDMPGSMDGLKLAHYVRRRWPPGENPRDFGARKGRRRNLARRLTFHTKTVRRR